MGKVKTFFKNNGKKILFVIGGIALVGAGGYAYSTINELRKDNCTLMEAASEGLFEEALTTTTRKLNTVKDRIEVISVEMANNPNNKELVDSLNRYCIKKDILDNRRNKFLSAQSVYEINCY